MERRKRTRSATAKVLENKSIEAEASLPRKTRRTRRQASSLAEGGNKSQAEADAQAENSLEFERIGAGLVGLNSVAEGSLVPTEGSQDQKEEAHEKDRATTDRRLHEDENVSTKRRRFRTASQEARESETQDAITEPVTEYSVKEMVSHQPQVEEGVPGTTIVGIEKLVAQEGIGSTDKLPKSEAEISQNGPSGTTFMSGVELPIQPNKRKDIHINSGAENTSEKLSAELTPKRVRRSSNEEIKANDTDGRQDLPTKPAANGKARTIKASPTKSDVATPESPVYSSRRRTRVSYKELSDEEAPASEPARGSSPHRAPKGRSNKTDKAGVNIKQEAVAQLPPTARKGRKGIWDKEVLLTSKRSRLAKAADLSDILNSATWDLLSPEEQQECLALLPTIDKVYGLFDSTNANCDPNGVAILAPDFFESNQVFKDSLVEFQDDLSQGRYEPSYLAEAAEARKARLEGAADKYKDGQYELFWGQRQRVGMIAGAAASIKLPELIKNGLLKTGDVWAYKRTIFGVVTLEKEVTVTEVTHQGGDKYSLVFHIPPGKHKFSHPSRKDITLAGVVSPQTLESAILKTHPDTPDRIPNGNSFKVFNIWRKGEDLGLLWEIRQSYWGGE